MKGQILDYSPQSNVGVISAIDGKRYQFVGSEWKGFGVPTRGMNVDFVSDGNKAKDVYPALGTTTGKNKTAAGLMALFLGFWGIHKFYLGFIGPALVFLLVNTIGLFITSCLYFIPNLALLIIATAEGIIYLTRSDEEFEQLYIVQKKQWF